MVTVSKLLIIYLDNAILLRKVDLQLLIRFLIQLIAPCSFWIGLYVFGVVKMSIIKFTTCLWKIFYNADQFGLIEIKLFQ